MFSSLIFDAKSLSQDTTSSIVLDRIVDVGPKKEDLSLAIKSIFVDFHALYAEEIALLPGKLELDFVIDTVLEKVLAEMKEKNKVIAVSSWGQVKYPVKPNGFSTDFFIIDIEWNRKNK